MILKRLNVLWYIKNENMDALFSYRINNKWICKEEVINNLRTVVHGFCCNKGCYDTTTTAVCAVWNIKQSAVKV